MSLNLEDLPLAKRVHLDVEDLPLAQRLAGSHQPKAWVKRKRVASPDIINLTGDVAEAPARELVVVDNPRTQDLNVIGVIGVPGQPRTLQQVRDVASTLLQKYLPGWTFGFDNASKRAGACYPTERHISIAKGLALSTRVPDSQVLETLLHEISHGLAPPGAHHGPVWKKIAMDIGCTGDRCHSFSFTKERYKLDCPCGKTNSYRSRVEPGATYSCRVCKQAVKITNTGITKKSIRH